jgi:hypothetical protein
MGIFTSEFRDHKNDDDVSHGRSFSSASILLWTVPLYGCIPFWWKYSPIVSSCWCNRGSCWSSSGEVIGAGLDVSIF